MASDESRFFKENNQAKYAQANKPKNIKISLVGHENGLSNAAQNIISSPERVELKKDYVFLLRRLLSFLNLCLFIFLFLFFFTLSAQIVLDSSETSLRISSSINPVEEIGFRNKLAEKLGKNRVRLKLEFFVPDGSREEFSAGLFSDSNKWANADDVCNGGGSCRICLFSNGMIFLAGWHWLLRNLGNTEDAILIRFTELTLQP
ncbi:hypothetical protein M9H77_37186 [Catharanthus roseus]|uniref:Uncharacterized protein n=1 Tax=Catharanthus roseus TaxID=4058 RepID=A0ACB9ZV94_CATRO|nr:hypothetical protein M9H77_37186 [Catharanthus roseus]